MSDIAKKIREIYKIANELEEMYPGRHFTPDGHMIGSIGEVVAAEEYDLELFVKRPTLFMMRRQKMGSRSR